MIFPLIDSWMKQRRQRIGFRISTGNVAGLGQIAVDAGKGKVPEFIATPMLSGSDVFNLQRCERRLILVKPTVLTSIVGSLPNKSFRRCVHYASKSDISLRTLACRIATNLLART